jgi:hypothetical protein
VQTQKLLSGSSEKDMLPEDEFNSLVELFYWLKNARDYKYTQSDTVEPTNDLNYSDNEIKRLVG